MQTVATAPRPPLEQPLDLLPTWAAWGLGGLWGSLLFTAGHGIGYKTESPSQLNQQGALVCSDWEGRHSPVYSDMYFTAEDVAAEAQLTGLISFHFACYSAGTIQPNKLVDDSVLPKSAAKKPFVARLPQRLLARPKGGALAIVGHLDRCFSAAPQAKAFTEIFRKLMTGFPVGAALEPINRRHASLATRLSHWLDQETVDGSHGDHPEEEFELARIWTANHDSSTYAIVGDPAVRVPGTALNLAE